MIKAIEKTLAFFSFFALYIYKVWGCPEKDPKGDPIHYCLRGSLSFSFFLSSICTNVQRKERHTRNVPQGVQPKKEKRTLLKTRESHSTITSIFLDTDIALS